MKGLLLVTSIIGLSVLLTYISYSNDTEIPNDSVITSNSSKNKVNKSFISVDFPFGAACSDKYINTLTCSENDNSEAPVFNLGELQHYLCAQEVKVISEELKRKELMLSSCFPSDSVITPLSEKKCN